MMGNKVIVLKFSSPLINEVGVIRSILFVDEAKGQRAIDEIRRVVDEMYEDSKFVRGRFIVSEITTVWEE
jgi:hypothetical protein